MEVLEGRLDVRLVVDDRTVHVGVHERTSVDGLSGDTGGCSYCDKARVAALCVAFNAVTSREESVEALDEGGVALEEVRNALDYSGGVDPM